MTGPHVNLDRRFRPVSDNEGKYPSRLFDVGFGGSKGWADLLATRRVIVLAEAGSGKSFEFESQWNMLTEAGFAACHAPVQDVARNGLRSALGREDRARFDAWRAGEHELCWFFIDSVDEAKDLNLRFDTALRQIADAISGLEEKAHILISSRFSDWDFIADKASVEKWLAVPSEMPPMQEEDYRDLVRATLSHRPPPKTRFSSASGDEIQTLLMKPLDESRVRKFVENVGIADPAAFVAEVAQGDLWPFASRPLDLGWMTDHWRRNGQLGTLAQMLEASITARLLDPKPSRQRNDPLIAERARRGLERIGAALHLCGHETLRVPTESIEPAATPDGLALETLLPDWPRDQQLRLLTRPVFDPATFGRVRLHNDNEETVRAYLTAQWLHRRLLENCPIQEVHDLLFVDIYGHAVIRPNMVHVAAWLALWRPAIADRVLERGPNALLKRGDPGSLPVPLRIRAVEARLAGNDGRDSWLFDRNDALRRLADPAFDPLLPDWWDRYGGDPDGRHLILLLIEAGGQAGGLEIARRASFDENLDETTQSLAYSALAAIGTDTDKQLLADHIVDRAGQLGRFVVLHGLDLLFPRFVSVDRFFAVIDEIGVKDEEGYRSVHPLGPELPPALSSFEDLDRFLRAIVERLGPLSDEEDENPVAGAFDSLAVAAGLRLLELTPGGVPDVVTQLVLKLKDHQSYRGIGPAEQQLKKALVSSPARRRESFWQAVVALREHPWVKSNQGGLNISLIQHFGWPGTFEETDLDWLIEGIRSQTDPRERELALNGAVSLWRTSGSRKILDRIKRAVEPDPDLKAMLTRWRSPPHESAELRESMARLKRLERSGKRRTEKRDRSWIGFIEKLRADPGALDNLRPQTTETVDSRLYHLWQLVAWRTSSRSRYSISDLTMVEPILGKEVTARFGKALIAFAEARRPTIPSDLPVDEGHNVSSFDVMGLGGISLAAATVPAWAARLSDAAADQAARYAMVELNGFPEYMGALVDARPAIVARILNAEIDRQLAVGNPEGHGMLDRLAYADPKIAAIATPHLLDRLRADEIPATMLRKSVQVLVRALPEDDRELLEIIRLRAISAREPEIAAQYLILMFVMQGDEAVTALRALMDGYGPDQQTILCSALLPRLFGDRFRRGELAPATLSFSNLEALVLIAYEAIRKEDDIERGSGEAYSPTSRDQAQDARNALFTRLAETPGEATHASLLRLAERDEFPVERDWLRELALRRADADAALGLWRPEDLIQFEEDFGKPPSTTAELQLLAMRRIEQIAHDLRHDKFAQGATLSGLAGETAVQIWLSDRLQSMAGNVFTVDRENQLVDGKKPDIMLHSRFSGVSLPIEVKILEKLRTADLERAIEVQLCGRYLRHASARHGILLLVHQRPRRQGWKLSGRSARVSTPEIINHAQACAKAIRIRSPEGPQPVIAFIDVSDIS
jgi:hypothetical protein